MVVKFSEYDFSTDPRWQEIETNLYFSSNDADENARILLKRKRKYFKANIDPDFEWSTDGEQTYGNKQQQQKQEQQSSSSEQTSSTKSSSNSSSRSDFSGTNFEASSPRSSASNSTATKSKYGVYLSWIQLALHFAVLLNVFTYALPVLGVEQQNPSFFRVMVLTFIAQGIYLIRQYGRPKWNAEYGRSIFLDQQSHFLFLSFILINATPSFLLIMPFAVRSILFVAGGLKQLLPKYSPRMYSLVSRFVERLVDNYAQLYQTNALLEVIAGFVLIFNLFTASRNFMLLFGYWQYLRIRYMLSDESKRAWVQVKSKTDGWISHPSVPGAVRNLYEKAVAMMATYTDQEAMAQQAQQQSGLMSKCSIQ